MKKIILILLVCSPLTVIANDQIPVDDSAPRDYVFAYERPGKRAPASVEGEQTIKQVKKVVAPKKNLELKKR